MPPPCGVTAAKTGQMMWREHGVYGGCCQGRADLHEMVGSRAGLIFGQRWLDVVESPGRQTEPPMGLTCSVSLSASGEWAWMPLWGLCSLTCQTCSPHGKVQRLGHRVVLSQGQLSLYPKPASHPHPHPRAGSPSRSAHSGRLSPLLYSKL